MRNLSNSKEVPQGNYIKLTEIPKFNWTKVICVALLAAGLIGCPAREEPRRQPSPPREEEPLCIRGRCN